MTDSHSAESSGHGPSDGQAPSHTAVVSQALERERRRELAAGDAPSGTAVDDDLDALAEHVTQTHLDDLN